MRDPEFDKMVNDKATEYARQLDVLVEKARDLGFREGVIQGWKNGWASGHHSGWHAGMTELASFIRGNQDRKLITAIPPVPDYAFDKPKR